MAKIEKTNASNNKNSNKQPKGTMPKDKLVRFKLTGNLEAPSVYVCRDTKKVAKSIRAISTYRQYVHNAAETKVPASLRMTAHYFLTPMSRADSDSSKDRGTVIEAPIADTETDTENNT